MFEIFKEIETLTGNFIERANEFIEQHKDNKPSPADNPGENSKRVSSPKGVTK